MNRTIRTLSEKEASLVYQAHLIFDFPPAEVKPWAAIEQRHRAGLYICLGLFEEEALRGYAFFAGMTDEAGHKIYLFDYFAVLPPWRGGGWGSFFLQHLPDSLPDARCVIAEVENPRDAADEADRALRQRRMAFYRRGGIMDTGVESRIYGVEYHLMAYVPGSPVLPDEIRQMYSAFYHSFFSPERYARQVVIR